MISAATVTPAITSPRSQERSYESSTPISGTGPRLGRRSADLLAMSETAALAAGGGVGRLRVALQVRHVGLQLLRLNLLGTLHLALDLRAHVGNGHHHQPSLAGVQLLPEVLEIVPAHSRRGM